VIQTCQVGPSLAGFLWTPMPPLVIVLILISTFMHAGWNLLLRSRRDNYTIAVMIAAGVACIALAG